MNMRRTPRPSHSTSPHTVVIGAGIGGLTAAALLLHAGHKVTVLEAHIYPGGSAGTFYHKGYHFDAGATLAGGFSADGPHARLAEKLGIQWPVQSIDPAWITHLPEQSITQWADRNQWKAERQRAFPHAEAFWRKQEWLADLAWRVAARSFPWPPGSWDETLRLAQAFRPALIPAAPFALGSIAQMVSKPADTGLLAFLDAQLIISAQTTATFANALYGSAALDLPRRGVNWVQGGIGTLAQTLVNWIRTQGGEVFFRQPVNQIKLRAGRVSGVKTTRGMEISCDALVANLTPQALDELIGAPVSGKSLFQRKPRAPSWGAFMLYLGVETARLPENLIEHHQVILDPSRPLGEGNSVFLSLSSEHDPMRAPEGMRAVTLSTHTAVQPWWDARKRSPQEYLALRADYTERVLRAAERAIPGIRSAVRLILPGTPVTFQFYTRRPAGSVGGYPQISLLDVRGPQTTIPNLWLVGDSIFPGQSTAATTLGGWRVAEAILRKQL